MKSALLVLLLVAATVHAEDSPLVKAAKATRAPKKKSTKKVITNADVKKSGGKVTVLPPDKKGAATASVQTKGPLTKYEEQQRAADAAAKRVALAEATVTRLQSELDRIEQTYYESNDPNYRDTAIKDRFEQTKRQLDDARKNLSDARDVQKRVTTPEPPPKPPAKTP